MAGAPVNNTAANERTLARLERKYDKRSAHIRNYYKDKKDIAALVRDNVIDPEHAAILLEEATNQFDEAERKKREKEGKVGAFGEQHNYNNPAEMPFWQWFKSLFCA